MLQARLETINLNEVLLYLGYRGTEVPEELEAQIAACAEDIRKTARPKVTYRIFLIEPQSTGGSGGKRAEHLHSPDRATAAEDTSQIKVNTLQSAQHIANAGDIRSISGVHPGIYLQGANFPLEGRDICRHLTDCSHAVLMAATLGPDVETLLMRAQVQDMSRALILDSCASGAIENVCDLFEADLRAQYEAQGQYLTDRFSPGYGDMPIGQQRAFCELLDTRRRIGLAVSQSGIMLPRKSVTAVMGVSDTPRTRRSSGCANCSMFRNCTIRKDGRFCSYGG